MTKLSIFALKRLKITICKIIYIVIGKKNKKKKKDSRIFFFHLKESVHCYLTTGTHYEFISTSFNRMNVTARTGQGLPLNSGPPAVRHSRIKFLQIIFNKEVEPKLFLLVFFPQTGYGERIIERYRTCSSA